MTLLPLTLPVVLKLLPIKLFPVMFPVNNILPEPFKTLPKLAEPIVSWPVTVAAPVTERFCEVLILPDALTVPGVLKFWPMTLPAALSVDPKFILPFIVEFPVTLKLPFKLANCGDNTNTLGAPLTANVILLALAGIRTLLDPFTIAVPTEGVVKLKLPAPSVDNTSPGLPPGIFSASALVRLAFPVNSKSPAIRTPVVLATSILGTLVTLITTLALGLTVTLLLPPTIWLDAGKVPNAKLPVASTTLNTWFAIPPVTLSLLMSVNIFPVAETNPPTVIPVLPICNALNVPVTFATIFPFWFTVRLLVPLLITNVGGDATQLKLPVPSVDNNWFAAPPVIVTFPIGPKFDLPVTVIPVLATTNTFALPATLVRTLPLKSIDILLCPLANIGDIGAAAKDKLPVPSVTTILLAPPPCILTLLILPKLAKPVFTSPVALIILVIMPVFVNWVTLGVPATLTLIFVLGPTITLLLPLTIDCVAGADAQPICPATPVVVNTCPFWPPKILKLAMVPKFTVEKKLTDSLNKPWTFDEKVDCSILNLLAKPATVNTMLLFNSTFMLLNPLATDVATGEDQYKLPVPSVVTYWLLNPPAICKLAIWPSETLDVNSKSTTPAILLTVKLFKLPKLVMLGWFDEVNVPVKKFAVTLFPKLALPDLKFPTTLKDVRFPTAVMFAWAGNVTVVATNALGTWPVTFAPVIPNNLDAFPANVPLVTPLLLLNLNDEDPLNVPLSLNWISVLLPAAGITAIIFANDKLPLPLVLSTSLTFPPKIRRLPISPKLAKLPTARSLIIAEGITVFPAFMVNSFTFEVIEVWPIEIPTLLTAKLL